MKHGRYRFIITLLLITAVSVFVALRGSRASSAAPAQGNAPENKFRRAKKRVEGQYIVRLKDDTRPEDVDFVANQLLVRHQGTTLGVYRHTIKGFAIQMPEEAAIALSHEPAVEYVEEDGIVKAASTQSNPPSWGLDRIDQRNLPLDTKYNFANVTTGAGVNVYIVDTGITPEHTEFLNAKRFFACFAGRKLLVRGWSRLRGPRHACGLRNWWKHFGRRQGSAAAQRQGP